MPVQPSKTFQIPPVSIPSYVFGSPSEPLPEKPIVVDPERPDDRFITLSTYRSWAQRLASGLRKAGLQTGDRVLFLAGNSIAYPIVFMGILMAGGVVSGTSPMLPTAQLIRQTQELSPTFIIFSPDGLANAKEAAQSIGLSSDRLFVFERECLFEPTQKQQNGDAGHRDWSELLDPEGASFDWTQYCASEQLAAINYTSGSTGLAKGVMVLHRNIVANACQYTDQQKDDPFGPEAGNQVNWVMWTPMYHVIGQNQYCVIGPRRGIRNHLMDRFDLEALFKYTEKYRADTMFLMPVTLISMFSHPATKKYDLSSVRTVPVGGSPLRQHVSDRFEAMMPHPDCRVVQGWGMTEITCIVIQRPPSDRSPSVACGALLPNVEGKIMTPDGATELGPGEAGEVWIRSPNVTQGYWKRPELTSQVFMPDGWLRTGDLGLYDEHGQWYIKDRLQDIIYADDEHYVLPTDLETSLLGLPGVRDAGVTSLELPGFPRKVGRAFVVLDEPAGATLDGVRKDFAERVTGANEYDRLDGGIYTISEIPRLPSGKVHRVTLREREVS